MTRRDGIAQIIAKWCMENGEEFLPNALANRIEDYLHEQANSAHPPQSEPRGLREPSLRARMLSIASGLPLSMEYEMDARDVWPARWQDLMDYYGDTHPTPAQPSAPDGGLRKSERQLLANLETIDVNERTVLLSVSTALWENWQSDWKAHVSGDAALAPVPATPPLDSIAGDHTRMHWDGLAGTWREDRSKPATPEGTQEVEK